MSKRREVRTYDYVNSPYDKVRALLTKEVGTVFHDATKSATSRAEAVVAELRASIGGVEVGTDVAIAIGDITETPRSVKTPPTTRIQFHWKASKTPRLFPVMHAELALYPLTATETQLEFTGTYDPPLGLVGAAGDAVLGHRIAEASVHRFLSDVAGYLRKRLGG